MKLIINNNEIKLAKCNKFLSRLMGNMFRKEIKNLIFPNCNSIHTFFMFKPITVIMLDKNYKVLHFYKKVKPWKLILPKRKVYYVIELDVNNNIELNKNTILNIS